MNSNSLWLGVSIVLVLVLLLSNQRSFYDLFTLTDNRNGNKWVIGGDTPPNGAHTKLTFTGYSGK